MIEEKYEILEKLREGGMGAIYKVRHLLLDEVRVVKMLRPHLQANQTLRQRFLHEARSAIKLRHPHIAELYDFELDDDGTGSIVMEYIDGVTLEEVIRSGTRPALGLLIQIGRQCLAALGYLHQRRFVHRDISPDNVMITRGHDGRLLVKLIDLGIAKSLETDQGLTQAGLFVGKVRYASPEHFGPEGAVVEPRSDLYALGLVLYELATGFYPIAGEDYVALMAGHLQRPPIPFDTSDPDQGVPEALRRTILTALEKRPEDRFPDAEAMRAALAQIVVDPSRKTGADLTDLLAVRRPAGKPVRQRLASSSSAEPDREGRSEAPKVSRSTAEAAVEELLERVIKNLNAGLHKAAIELLREAQRLAPNHGEVVALLEVLTPEGSTPPAARAQGPAPADEPGSDAAPPPGPTPETTATDIQRLLDRGLLDDATEALTHAEETWGSIELLRGLRERLDARIRRERDERVERLVERAIGRLNQGHATEARQILELAHELDPKHLEVNTLREQLGVAPSFDALEQTAVHLERLLERGLLDDARSALADAERSHGARPLRDLRGRLDRLLVRETSDRVEILIERAVKLLNSGQFREAVPCLREALTLDPENLEAQTMLAQLAPGDG